MNIIAENQTQVKQIARRLINKKNNGLSRPLKKLVMEVPFGILLSGSCNLSEIGRKLGEESKLKHTVKRLSRMLEHGDRILDYSNRACLNEMKVYLNDKTVLALDGGDIVHTYGNKFENLATVRDGSKKELSPGYWLNQVSGYDPVSKESFPLLLDIYSTKEKGFTSSNDEAISMIKRVREVSAAKVLWVLDRGYDGEVILKYLLLKDEDFMVRMTGMRNLLFAGEPLNIKKLAGAVNRRNKYGAHSRYGSRKVKIKLGYGEYKVTLVVVKNKYSKEPIIFLSKGWIKNNKELKRRIRGYFYRWGVEESYRFEKQGFGIERSTVRKYDRIKSLIGLSLFSWLLLIKAKQDRKVKHVLNQQAKPEKTKRKNQPKFLYYRLLKGMQNLFRSVSMLFSFRDKSRRKKKEIRGKRFTTQLLFTDKTGNNLSWQEVSS